MIRVTAITKHKTILHNLQLENLQSAEIDWFWVDFDCPTEYEASFLDSYFHFHPLAIEDCLNFLQRPKMDHFEDHHFLVLHSINPATLEAAEVDLFLGRNFIVTYHSEPQQAITDFHEKLCTDTKSLDKGPIYASYAVIDKLVDYYFPVVYQTEDSLLGLEGGSSKLSSKQIMDEVFDIRADLLQIRKTIFPMRDLLYRMINSEKIEGIKKFHAYFRDVHDHLLKLSEMIESSREITSDIRDNFISVNSYRMNNIMKTLTVITTIFMPLTFIAGIYGMNFYFMPELNWKYGYFITLAVMLSIGIGMFSWFKFKGWFR
ncbi:MAG: metal transporter [Paenibacillus sp.]|nr:metal transporter [Paenibacillus sp.]